MIKAVCGGYSIALLTP
ncbi:hypothetical protein P3584_23590 [Vibrio parahaemolyticus]|nr:MULTISPECIES: hypothetical protein [Vibrio]MCU8208212.1 hypothetical protein [Vibrio vulnificus]MDF4637935.1 hypothetical protein [Vibrio parahaemolyticus]MDF4896752.1 hypothetical protein [Vibrio parahaemolyticus]WMN65227.1 hypothetical protein NI388_07010 [Vibrio parahaemolyticus]WMN75873.1 hypothetical protein NI386_15085 [Vibrio parahaemolyticus]